MIHDTTKRPCPVPGCEHRGLVRTYDGEFDIVSCPAHGFQYPIPGAATLGVPSQRMEEFLGYARGQPRARGVHRLLVFSPSRWAHMAEEFMRQYGPCEDDDFNDGWERGF